MANIKSFGNTLNPIFGDKNSHYTDEDKEIVSYINISNVHPRKNQPRKNLDENALNELTASIKEQGIIQPIIVRSIGKNIYEIIVGERRWQAAKKIGLNKIPAIVKNYSSQDTMIVALMENIHRQDLNPIEEAVAIQALISEYSLTHEIVAEKIGKARTTVSNLLRLLELSDLVRELLEEGCIEMGHARALLGLDRDDQLKIAHVVINNKLTVRQTENLVRKYKDSSNDQMEINSLVDKIQIETWKKNLSEKIHANVSINVNHKGKGRVVINLNSIEEINWFVENINLKTKAI